MVEILPARENPKPVFHICMNLNHFKSPSVCCLLGFFLFLNAGVCMEFILLAKREFNRKACFWKTVKGCARQYGSLWEQPQPDGQTSRMQQLSSPPCSLNCRESRQVHWRPRPTMDSHGIAGTHFSCNWICFWSLILEGEPHTGIAILPTPSTALHVCLFIPSTHMYIRLTYSYFPRNGSIEKKKKIIFIIA